MGIFLHHLSLCAPLFLLVGLGWGVVKCGLFQKPVADALATFTFRFLMPALLFKLMGHLSEMPPIDWWVLIVFFGASFLLYYVGRVIAAKVFDLDATGQTIVGMGGIFGNNVQLGVPIVQLSLGYEAMPTISILIIFNVLILWTLAIASVEFAKTEGRMNWHRLASALFKVFKNPIVVGILLGSAWGLTGWKLSPVIEKTLDYVALSTTPMALIVVGMGLAQHSFTRSLRKGFCVSVLKLIAQPVLVYTLARLVGLGTLETQAVTLMAALPVAINLYLMASEFNSEEGTASNSIFVSTLLSALGVPITLTLLGVS